jgi:TonB family protein
MIRFFLSMFFMTLLQIPAARAQTARPAESQYLARIQPRVASVWDESVILHASLLLKPADAFNATSLKVGVELMLDTEGKVSNASVVASSGNEPFDHTALEAVLSITGLPRPPEELVSDDGLVHVFWTLQRAEPFSPLRNASVRYVRFTPENAIARYLQSGLVAPAWKRLLETEQGGSVSRSSLEAFILNLMLRFLPPTTLPADAQGPITSLLHWEALPAPVLVAYSRAIGDDAGFSRLLVHAAASPDALCRLFEDTLAYSERRAAQTLQALLERSELPCGSLIAEKGAASNWASVKLLSTAAALRQSATLSDADRQSLISRATGADLVPAIRAMGLSRKVEFYDFLTGLQAKETDTEVSAELMGALGSLPHGPAMLKMIAGLKHKQARVRRAAIAGLAAYQGPDREKHAKTGIWDLHKLVKSDPEPEVRRLAAAAIITLAARDLKNENNKHYFALVLRETDAQVVEAMINVLPPAVDQAKKKLIGYLGHATPEVKLAAARRLRALRNDPEVEAALKPWVNASDERLRYFALGYAGVPELTLGFEKLSMLSRTESAFHIARRDGTWLIKAADPLVNSGKPADLLNALPLLLGLTANAR